MLWQSTHFAERITAALFFNKYENGVIDSRIVARKRHILIAFACID